MKKHTYRAICMLALLGLFSASCGTTTPPPGRGSDGLQEEMAGRISIGYQVQLPLRRILLDIEHEIKSGNAPLALQKLRMLRHRLRGWADGKLPAHYADEIIGFDGVFKTNAVSGTEGERLSDDPFENPGALHNTLYD